VRLEEFDSSNRGGTAAGGDNAEESEREKSPCYFPEKIPRLARFYPVPLLFFSPLPLLFLACRSRFRENGAFRFEVNHRSRRASLIEAFNHIPWSKPSTVIARSRWRWWSTKRMERRTDGHAETVSFAIIQLSALQQGASMHPVCVCVSIYGESESREHRATREYAQWDSLGRVKRKGTRWHVVDIIIEARISKQGSGDISARIYRSYVPLRTQHRVSRTLPRCELKDRVDDRTNRRESSVIGRRHESVELAARHRDRDRETDGTLAHVR